MVTCGLNVCEVRYKRVVLRGDVWRLENAQKCKRCVRQASSVPKTAQKRKVLVAHAPMARCKGSTAQHIIVALGP